MINPKILKILSSQPYSVKNDVLYMIEEPGKGFTGKGSDALINKLKVFLKKYPAIFDVIHQLLGASRVGLSAKKAIKDLEEDKIILNLGSGTKVTRQDVINVDFYPFRNVDIVADVNKLPFKNESVDAVICESLLEHLRDPRTALKEMNRVLKPGGLAYITAPFIAGFHSSPNDYYRWSKEGLRAIMQEQGFVEKEIGIRRGPTSAFLSAANDWLATILSFGSGTLQQILLMILMSITFPLKIFDYFIYRFRTSENIASAFYYFGRKGPLKNG